MRRGKGDFTQKDLCLDELRRCMNNSGERGHPDGSPGALGIRHSGGGIFVNREAKSTTV